MQQNLRLCRHVGGGTCTNMPDYLGLSLYSVVMVYSWGRNRGNMMSYHAGWNGRGVNGSSRIGELLKDQEGLTGKDWGGNKEGARRIPCFGALQVASPNSTTRVA